MISFADIFGTTWPVFLGMTVVFMGGCSFMTGQALAATWRSAWFALPYCILLGCGDRFLVYALFQGRLLLLSGYLGDTAILLAIALVAYRLTRTRQMVSQYPWLYERAGPFGWRERPPQSP